MFKKRSKNQNETIKYNIKLILFVTQPYIRKFAIDKQKSVVLYSFSIRINLLHEIDRKIFVSKIAKWKPQMKKKNKSKIHQIFTIYSKSSNFNEKLKTLMVIFDDFESNCVHQVEMFVSITRKSNGANS